MIYNHIDDVTVTAQFAWENDLYYRYRLEIVLNDAAPTGKTACVVMQNPSRAGENVADKSVQFMEKVVFKKELAEFAGVRRLIVVNQFAYIQTNDFQGLPHEIGALNDATIKDALNESDIVILGWGAANRFTARKSYVLDLLADMPQKAIYQTRMHPSRGRYDGFIQPYL
ncbi:DUF1643 domain-containing protein [Sulfuriferula nivalis]|uniref:DUF1643 domain-containing protein n=1 Tax=Sulfuriferula nivalis TaxID=2675298 RepID=A0A809S8N6_9PROT|nr:DUF1643 domain-containing protein [Sulfuriferula nivalis]BBP00342.1 hypothetical protein SFSGTM_10500 [Sulfuriferula nivalis]